MRTIRDILFGRQLPQEGGPFAVQQDDAGKVWLLMKVNNGHVYKVEVTKV